MQRFRFRLQRLLHLRHKETEAARNALEATLAEWRRADEALRLAESEQSCWRLELQALQQRGMPAGEWALAQRSDQVLADRLAVTAVAAAAAQERVQAARTALQAAEMRSEVLERLRARQFAAHALAARREEQAELDAVALSRFSHG